MIGHLTAEKELGAAEDIAAKTTMRIAHGKLSEAILLNWQSQLFLNFSNRNFASAEAPSFIYFKPIFSPISQILVWGLILARGGNFGSSIFPSAWRLREVNIHETERINLTEQ